MAKKILVLNGTARSKTPSGPASVGCGYAVTSWVESRLRAQAKDTAGVEIETLVPYKDLQLPIEVGTVPAAMHHVGAEYQSDPVKKWSKLVESASVVLFVTPEYNGVVPHTLALAINLLGKEWQGKPIAVVSYGFGGGKRCAEVIKTNVAPTLKMELIEPMASVIYPREKGMGNELTPDTADEVLSSQSAQVDETIKAILAKV